MPKSITVVVGKARPVGNQDIPDAFIAVTGESPEHETLDQQDAFFDYQAVLIESLLHRSLPGGLYDRLAAQMLQRAASHLAVSHVRPATQSVASVDPINAAAVDLLAACASDGLGYSTQYLLKHAADLLETFAPNMARELRRKSQMEDKIIAIARGEEVQDA